MDDPLRDAWVKHERALSHIQALNAACAELVAAEPRPYRLTVAFEPDADCHVARFLELRLPDGQLGAMVGDVAHNLRAALDAAAWQLAIRHDRKAAKGGRRHVVFPLGRSEKAFRRHDALRFFDELALGAIEGLQPYERPGRRHVEALRLLAALSNADRHRVVASRFASLDFSGVGYRPESGSVHVVEDLTRPGRILTGGSPVACVTVDGAVGAETTVHVEGEPSLQIAFTTSKAKFGPTAIMAMFATVEYALLQLGLLLS
jgi:hypothetical protein